METLADLDRGLADRTAGEQPIDVLASRWLAHDSRDAAARLFRRLNQEPSEAIVGLVLDLLATLAARDAQWSQIVQGSVTRRGRCPKAFRGVLLAQLKRLQLEDSALTREELTDPLFERERPRVQRIAGGQRALKRYIIEFRKEVTDITGVPRFLINALSAATPETPSSRHRPEIGVDWGASGHYYISGLAVLATWIRARECMVRHSNLTKESQRYLDEIGFVDAIERSRHVVRIDARGWNLALQSIVLEAQADVHANSLLDIIEKHGVIRDQRDRVALGVTLAETIENVIRHAGGPSQAFVGAQYYPRESKLSIVVVDNGIGIREAFRRGRSARLATEAATDAAALKLAIRPFVTSKPVSAEHATGHSGYGLYVVSELAVRNHGTFVLTSGSATIACYRRVGLKRQMDTYTHREWNGTILSLLFDLKRELPISEVYRSLPSDDEDDVEDFFNEG